MKAIDDRLMQAYLSVRTVEKRDKDAERLDDILRLRLAVRNDPDFKQPTPQEIKKAFFHAADFIFGQNQIMHATSTANIEYERIMAVIRLAESGQKIDDAVKSVYDPFIETELGVDINKKRKIENESEGSSPEIAVS